MSPFSSYVNGPTPNQGYSIEQVKMPKFMVDVEKPKVKHRRKNRNGKGTFTNFHKTPVYLKRQVRIHGLSRYEYYLTVLLELLFFQM